MVSGNAVIERALKEGRTILTEIESKKLLADAGIKVVETVLAASAKEVVEISERIGYPVVLKIASPDITHKSDIGGVKVGLKDRREAEKAYEEIMSAVREKQPDARIEGVSVQKMAEPGIEIIIGMFKDAQFGPVLMFGLGGIFVEVLKDVTFRVVPLTKRDAHTMINEIKGYSLLTGYRGQEPVDIPFLEGMLLKLSSFAEKNPQIKELDLNPVFAYGKGAVAVDARIVIEAG